MWLHSIKSIVILIVLRYKQILFYKTKKKKMIPEIQWGIGPPKRSRPYCRYSYGGTDVYRNLRSKICETNFKNSKYENPVFLKTNVKEVYRLKCVHVRL